MRGLIQLRFRKAHEFEGSDVAPHVFGSMGNVMR